MKTIRQLEQQHLQEKIQLILAALEKHKPVAAAATALGVNRTSVHRFIKTHGLAYERPAKPVELPKHRRQPKAKAKGKLPLFKVEGRVGGMRKAHNIRAANEDAAWSKFAGSYGGADKIAVERV